MSALQKASLGAAPNGSRPASADWPKVRGDISLRKLEDAQLAPSAGRVLNLGDGVALRLQGEALFKPKAQYFRGLVGVGGTSMRNGEMRDDALVFASIRPIVREGFGQRVRHRDEWLRRIRL